jgi:hypothetical protein
MEWTSIIGIPVQNLFNNLLVLKLLHLKFVSPNAIFRLQLLEKYNSPISLASIVVYMLKKNISKTSFTTKGKSKIISSKNLNTPISSYKKKSKIRNVLEKKWKKNDHLEIEYMMLEGCLVKPFIKLGVRKSGLQENFGLWKNNKLIPHPEP